MAIYNLINEEKKKHKLAPLSWDANLAKVARKHSQYIAERDFFDRINPEGKTPRERILAMGHIDYRYTGIGENIFMCSLTYPDLAKQAVKGWMNSQGHRQNILTASFEREGIGVAISRKRHRIYVVQNFCEKVQD